MSFGGESAAVPALKFVSEDEIAEQKQRRQEEWERVRQPDQPLEAPEEVIDSRCLFEQLEDQKNAKQAEYDEQQRIRNQVKGLEDEEAEFLDFVSQRQMDITKEREQETDKVLQEYRNAVVNQVVAKPDGAEAEKKVTKPSSSSSSSSAGQSKKSQMALLAGAIKRKSTDVPESSDTKKSKPDKAGSVESETGSVSSESAAAPAPVNRPGEVVGVLPGLCYSDSEDDSFASSSESEDINTDLLIKQKCVHVVMGKSTSQH